MSSTQVSPDTRTGTAHEASTVLREVPTQQSSAAPPKAVGADARTAALLRRKRFAWASVWVLLLGLGLVAVATIVWFVPLAVTGVAVGGTGLVLARCGRLMTSPVEYDTRVTPRWAGGPSRRSRRGSLPVVRPTAKTPGPGEDRA